METQGPRQSEGRARHTPGPWSAGGGPSSLSNIFKAGDYEIHPPVGEAGPVAIVAGPANARLIAASPKLLDACKQALDLFEDDEGIAQVLMAAIAKAEGRP